MSNKVAEVPLYDMLQQLKRETSRGLRVCLPGSISGVDLTTGTVSVKIGVMKKTAQINLPTGLDTFYADLTMCPVFTLQGGGIGVVNPISVGDECMVVFSDRCIDAWFDNGQPVPLPSLRLHDINDGFVLVGLNSLKNKLLTPLLTDEGGVCETDNAFGAKLVINSSTSKVSIKNGTQSLAVTLTALITALTALMTALNALVVNTGTGMITPGTATAFAAVQTQITAVQVQIAGLLY